MDGILIQDPTNTPEFKQKIVDLNQRALKPGLYKCSDPWYRLGGYRGYLAVMTNASDTGRMFLWSNCIGHPIGEAYFFKLSPENHLVFFSSGTNVLGVRTGYGYDSPAGNQCTADFINWLHSQLFIKRRAHWLQPVSGELVKTIPMPMEPICDPKGFKNLTMIKPGDYRIDPRVGGQFATGERKGFVNVEWDGDDLKFLWTNGRFEHNLRGKDPAFMVTISKAGELMAYYESALSMWLTWGYGRGTEEDRHNMLDKANWLYETFLVHRSYTRLLNNPPLEMEKVDEPE